MLAADAYMDARVLTASPQQLHLLVVNGAIRHCLAAKKAIEADDREAKWSRLNDARAHVAELLGGLSDADEDFLDNLRSLFKYILHQLNVADVREDVSHVDSALLVLESYRETWVQAIEVA